MTSPHFPTLPSGANFHALPLQFVSDWDPVSSKKEDGAIESRARYEADARSWLLKGINLPIRDADIVQGFLRDRKGGSNFWYWDNIVVPIWSPYDAPTTSTTAGGALPLRTYYISYTWSNAMNETEDSQESTQIVALNNYATVTIPAFPAGVTEARIYVGTVSDTLYYTAKITTSAGTWTEDDASTTVDADSNSGQPVLNVAATTNYQVGSTVIINSGGPRQEVKTILSIQAGISLTMTANLTYTHTLGDADAVATVAGSASAAAAPTSNTLVGEEVKVHVVGPIKSQWVAVGSVWNIEFMIEEVP